MNTFIEKNIARWQHIPYTFKHIVCINKLAINHSVWNVKYLFHDMDKIFMYIFCFWMTTKDVHNIHRNWSRHHCERADQKKMNWTMAILDWESARFTKPDKPLNARGALMMYYPQFTDICTPIILQLGL